MGERENIADAGLAWLGFRCGWLLTFVFDGVGAGSRDVITFLSLSVCVLHTVHTSRLFFSQDLVLRSEKYLLGSIYVFRNLLIF